MASSQMNPRSASPHLTTSSSPAPGKPSRFRFKSKRPGLSSSSEGFPQSCHRSSRSRRHHHHRSKRRDSTPPQPPLSPTAAFRESLFDALADDEGAAFWEGVYGQPIHTYSAYAPHAGGINDGVDGNLERMDEEEYVAHVRSKMWEKSHGYILEERRRKEESMKAKKKKQEEVRIWDEGVEDALRRGEERRRKGKWVACWQGYLKGWEKVAEIRTEKLARDQLVWPVESGRQEDVSYEEVKRFFKNAPLSATTGQPVDLGVVLKAERVKWHPDKVQQRFGSRRVDDNVMKAVTAVFQAIDRMWSETRS